MATEAARLKGKESKEGKNKTVLTLTGLLMEGDCANSWPNSGRRDRSRGR